MSPLREKMVKGGRSAGGKKGSARSRQEKGVLKKKKERTAGHKRESKGRFDGCINEKEKKKSPGKISNREGKGKKMRPMRDKKKRKEKKRRATPTQRFIRQEKMKKRKVPWVVDSSRLRGGGGGRERRKVPPWLSSEPQNKRADREQPMSTEEGKTG